MSSAAPSDEATRLLPTEGGFNLRDFGGYTTMDGGLVRRGMLYRSGTMALLTQADETYLAGLGIRFVCDLRRQKERQNEPTRWCEPAGVEYWSRDYDENSGLLNEIARTAAPTAESMRATMIALYRELHVDHAPSYRMMFARLLDGHVPMLFNCSAGKDRTGVGAALVLHALGVSREMIYEDYQLTNRADFTRLWHGKGKQSMLARLAAESPDAVVPILTADPDYLDTMYDEFDRNFGGIDGYLAREIGVDADAQRRLRALLVD
jgi:protein-tyrosine phosphatase